jgi:CheY-like chemotaxis protein
LIQKGDVARESLLFKVKSMFGEKTQTDMEAKIEIPDPKPRALPKEPAISKKTTGANTILVIEDNPDNMLSIKAVLKNRYTILEAWDGEEGLKKALAEKPDLILLDMFLPKMDGITVAGKVKEEKTTCHIPIIAMTARAMKGDKEMILQAGCDDYISKPFDPEEVIEKIKNRMLK